MNLNNSRNPTSQERGEYTTIIIGAGPAGIASAIQLQRAGHNFLLLEKGPIGGLINNANLVENYPGFPNGLTGPELSLLLKEHLESLEIPTTADEVLNVHLREDRFSVTTQNSTYRCKNLVVASGTKPKRLDKSVYDPEVEDKIFYQIYPLKDIRQRNIAVIGGGDAAFDYALNLSRENKIHLLYRRPRCLTLLYNRAYDSERIRLYPETEINKIKNSLGGLKLETDNPIYKSLFSDIVVAALGREPCIDFLPPEIRNHLLEREKIKGLYYIGDVVRGVNRQVAIAVGDGINTAMDIIKEGA